MKGDTVTSIQVTKGPPVNGAGRKQQQKDPHEEAKQSRVGQLFDRLGGSGKLKIYRLDGNGEENYCKTMDVTDDLCDGLEEALAKQCGGGAFVLKGFHRVDGSTRCVGVATVHIDEKTFEPKQTEREKVRDGEKLPSASEARLVALLEQQLALSEKRQTMGTQSAQELFASLLHYQAQTAAQTQAQQLAAHSQTMTLVMTLLGARQGDGNGLAAFQQVTGVLKNLGVITPGGTAAAEPDNRTFGQRILENPLNKMAERVGDKVGDMIAKKMGDDDKPAPAAAAPVAALPAPAATAAAAPAPPPQGKPRLPAGAKPLTPEQLQELRTSGKLKQPNRPPAAPVATEVLKK